MPARRLHRSYVLLALAIFLSGGCTPIREYVANGFKVGPNYCPPEAMVANDWIDAGDVQVHSSPAELGCWWSVFRDPILDELVGEALQQNLSLREAGYRVLQARAARATVVGTLFPQQQEMAGGFSRNAMSKNTANMELLGKQFYDEWNVGFGLGWELDFWGRFRRAIEAADADLDASVANYDQVMVTLLADVAATYTEIRTLQKRILLARENASLQHETYTIANARFRGGQVSELDVSQAESTFAQTEALVPQLELQLRQAENRLCILLGSPPIDLTSDEFGRGSIPTAPAELVVGIPANLLRNRPDVRRAEREIAAQSARVGVATAELYPHIGITGTIGYSAEQFTDLTKSASLAGGVGPSFQWNVLNYGRLLNNIRFQDAKLAELIVAYQNTVLTANAEAEDAIAQFLRGRQRTEWLARSVAASENAAKVAMAQYRGGLINYNWVTLVQQNLVNQQELLAQAQGETVLGVIETYRALGGGWRISRRRSTAPTETRPQEASAPEGRDIASMPTSRQPIGVPVPSDLPPTLGVPVGPQLPDNALKLTSPAIDRASSDLGGR